MFRFAEMLSDVTRKELADIISGNVVEGRNDNLSAAANYLRKGFSTNTKVEKNFEQQALIKEKQKQFLIAFANEKSLWIKAVTPYKFLTEGGEAKIYFKEKSNTVIKLNDAVYYSTWLDFFNSVFIHNLFFNRTAYTLLGFAEVENCLYAVLEQPFIVSEQPTNLADVKLFLEFNGFKNIRNHDYYNEELGLILEHMHDENVLTNSSVLFFIDTVFYIHKKEI